MNILNFKLSIVKFFVNYSKDNEFQNNESDQSSNKRQNKLSQKTYKPV